jgi:hypothetical protein
MKHGLISPQKRGPISTNPQNKDVQEVYKCVHMHLTSAKAGSWIAQLLTDSNIQALWHIGLPTLTSLAQNGISKLRKKYPELDREPEILEDLREQLELLTWTRRKWSATLGLACLCRIWAVSYAAAMFPCSNTCADFGTSPVTSLGILFPPYCCSKRSCWLE